MYVLSVSSKSRVCTEDPLLLYDPVPLYVHVFTQVWNYTALLYYSIVHLEYVIRCTQYVYVYTWYVRVHTIVVFSTHFSVPSALFLSWEAVLLHLALASKLCFAVKLGFQEIQVDVQTTSDVMAGADGAEGPAPDVLHQPEGTMCH